MQRASLPLRLFQRSVGAPLLPRRQLSAALPQRSAPKRHEAAAELDPKKSENLSFIQRVKVAGVNALYGGACCSPGARGGDCEEGGREHAGGLATQRPLDRI